MHIQFHGDVTQSMQFSTGYSSQDSLKKTADNQGMGLIIAQCTSQQSKIKSNNNSHKKK